MVVDHDLVMIGFDVANFVNELGLIAAAEIIICLNYFDSNFDLVGPIDVATTAAGVIGYYIILYIMEFINLDLLAHIN